MNVQVRVGKLEALLARIERKRAEPRPSRREQSKSAAAERDLEVESDAAPPEPAVKPALTAFTAPEPAEVTVEVAKEPLEDFDIEDFDEEVVDITEAREGETGAELDGVPASGPVQVSGGAAADLGSEEPASIGEALGKVAAARAEHAVIEDEVEPARGATVQTQVAKAGLPGESAGDAHFGDGAIVPGFEHYEGLDPSGGEAVIPLQRRAGPTMEQLGNTVNLDPTPGPGLELEVEVVEPVVDTAPLEAVLPSRRFAGGYEQHLSPPDYAGDDLLQMDRELDAEVRGAPEVVARPPAPSQGPVAEFVAGSPVRSLTFVQALDRALSLTES